MNELFAVEPRKDFKITRLGKYKGVNINVKIGNNEFWGSDHFAVRSVNETALFNCVFSLKKKVFLIGEIESIKMVYALQTYYFVPASVEDMKKGISKIKEQY